MGTRVQIFNQVSEVHSVKELAQLVSKKFGVDVEFLPNPRKELAENELRVSNQGLKSLGFVPKTLNENLIEETFNFANRNDSSGFSVINNSPKWVSND